MQSYMESQRAENREFLSGIDICDEIISTPSHSPDSVSLLLNDGDCFVGDLQPRKYGDLVYKLIIDFFQFL